MQDVVKTIDDVTIRSTLDHALTAAEQVGSQRIYQQAKECKTKLKGMLNAERFADANYGLCSQTS